MAAQVTDVLIYIHGIYQHIHTFSDWRAAVQMLSLYIHGTYKHTGIYTFSDSVACGCASAVLIHIRGIYKNIFTLSDSRAAARVLSLYSYTEFIKHTGIYIF